MVDGVEQPWEPDYAIIEFGSVAAFTVTINETEVSDEVVLKAHDGLSALRERLQCVGEACKPLGITIIEEQLKAALPLEYHALAVSGMRLFQAKLADYINTNQVDIVPEGVMKKTMIAVIDGALLAFDPHVQRIKAEQ
jgi:hypothetical protein